MPDGRELGLAGRSVESQPLRQLGRQDPLKLDALAAGAVSRDDAHARTGQVGGCGEELDDRGVGGPIHGCRGNPDSNRVALDRPNHVGPSLGRRRDDKNRPAGAVDKHPSTSVERCRDRVGGRQDRCVLRLRDRTPGHAQAAGRARPRRRRSRATSLRVRHGTTGQPSSALRSATRTSSSSVCVRSEIIRLEM